ncbi:putative F-box associated interaction domain-containing protein [Arabidopsis thaliana]|uniref:At5g36190 n=3 Tax=Arabidopsis TaxID=3701 RepID=Q9LVX8_ARATH|nr:F-box protein interaction domain protein [Arabidopsis thaliana]ABK32131.1 At5g36190 [Arabidopsis thaliana]AED94055.1 F-box protein interaction domain protein [Arabidopsis thaliana]KAG7604000.1 F-box associated interaction domain [Arabidopsis thaliana x Arabidopsis arenosa]BAA96894.1 unnamed protein product [Arabidopsis thaliana]|eukprot:NP_198468.1 F-box protein interaction domain protein [Arabidopsis thaliana]
MLSYQLIFFTAMVYCYCYTSPTMTSSLRLRTLILGKQRWIKPRNFYQFCDKYAIGYENKKNNSLRNHKILRFNDGSVANYRIYEFEIYNFNSDSWKVFDFTPDWDISFTDLSVSLKGYTYWLIRSNGLIQEYYARSLRKMMIKNY